MGSSKIILVSGLCVMLGFYAYVIQRATESIVASGTDRRTETQARMLSYAAVNAAAFYLSIPSGTSSYTRTNVPMNGGLMSWSIDTSAFAVGQAVVTAKGMFGQDTVQQRAVLGKTSMYSNWNGRKKWNRWGVQKMYGLPPSFSEVGYRADMRN